jgi:glucose-6-phosphate isomerase
MALQFKFSKKINSLDLNRLDAFTKIIDNPKTQFFHTFKRNELVAASKEVFLKFKNKKTFVQIGIGGSSLGPEMLVTALKKSLCQFIFINNIDPDEIHDQLNSVDFKNSLFYFVSKSGGTAETLAALAIISNFLTEKGVGQNQLKDYFVFATDKNKSELLDLGKSLSISMLEIPSDVGGRFCALTPVGYLPGFFAGIDVNQLIEGALATQKLCLLKDHSNVLLQTAQFLYDLKIEKNISQTVFMPYSSKLKIFSSWFTQLWAESLGKKLDKVGKIIHTGFTPIVAYGATDQHSQVQLFMEGPQDKAFIMIEVLNFTHDQSLKNNFEGLNLKKLSPYTVAQLMQAEFHGTLKALEQNDRPYVHLSIDRNDEFHVGALILFFESLTALMGDYLNVDPFDQPGVEAGKIYAFEFLNQLK